MQPEVQVLLSAALTFGVPLVLAVRELLTLERKGAAPGEHDGRRSRLPVAPPPDDAPVLPLLPPCPLLEARAGQAPARPRLRLLEEA